MRRSHRNAFVWLLTHLIQKSDGSSMTLFFRLLAGLGFSLKRVSIANSSNFSLCDATSWSVLLLEIFEDILLVQQQP
jgi:hypothetical protein